MKKTIIKKFKYINLNINWKKSKAKTLTTRTLFSETQLQNLQFGYLAKYGKGRSPRFKIDSRF